MSTQRSQFMTPADRAHIATSSGHVGGQMGDDGCPGATHQSGRAPVGVGSVQPPINLVGVSMPRAGHHLLMRLLDAVLKDRLFYCEYYSEAGCCQAFPCTGGNDRQLVYQKNHDFDEVVPLELGDVLYVVQYRAPIPAILSAREHYALKQYDPSYGDPIGRDRAEYSVWLGLQAGYYQRFYERWLAAPKADRILVDYDRLSERPAEVVTDILARAGLPVHADQISEAVVAVTGRAGRYGEEQFVPRATQSSRYFDAELLAVFESILVDHVPGFVSERQFSQVEYRQTVTWAVFEARRLWREGRPDAALALIEQTCATAPECALLLAEHAMLLRQVGKLAEAHAVLSRAVTLPPPHPAILQAHIAAALALGDLASARDSSGRLVELIGPVQAGVVHQILARNEMHAGVAADPAGRPAGASSVSDDREMYVCALERELLGREVALRQQEQQTYAFQAAAAERLRLISRQDAEIVQLRGELESAHHSLAERAAALQQIATIAAEREAMIHQITAAADERTATIVRLSQELAEHSRVLEQWRGDLVAKERVITDLHDVAEERLRLIQVLDAHARAQRETTEQAEAGKQPATAGASPQDGGLVTL